MNITKEKKELLPNITKLESFKVRLNNSALPYKQTFDVIKVEQLIEENIDFAFRLGPLADSTMTAIELFEIEPVVCVRPDVLERYGVPQTIEEIANLPYVFEGHIDLAQRARDQLPTVKFNHFEHHHVSNHSALYEMAIRGMGAAVLFRHTVNKDLEECKLIDLTAEIKLNPLPVYLMYQGLSYSPKKIRCFIDYFKKHMRE